ncbi:hypothetical protein llap_22395 [Limosa lapponica baueri]|uniref:Uncharacterized protein n=1 Tax=Limosa lapponica baueri TaxID=1758121 RepID=A0A2I0T0H5_LIMLA|nr:hypothetical protein llap_22395 [Limosa lapponica baueri]
MLISRSFTSLSVLGFLGCLFMMSLSACSYAREIAGTFGGGYLTIPMFLLETKKKPTKDIHHVSAQVNTEDGDCSQWKGYVRNDEDQERRDFRNVTSQGVSNGLLQVIKDQAPWGKKERTT